MEKDFVAESSRGYFQSSAAQFNTAALVSVITGLNAILSQGVVMLIIQAEGQAMRWRDDGTAPTASVGMIIPAGGELLYTARNYQSLQLISITAGALVNVTAYAHTRTPGG